MNSRRAVGFEGGIPELFWRGLAVAASLAVTVTQAASQSGHVIRGNVTLGVPAAIPISGVMIEISDRTGTVVARTLSRELGKFDAVLPDTGTYSLRALRIGFRPTVVDAVRVTPGGPTLVEVTLGTSAVSLATVRVGGTDDCGRTSRLGAEVADVWEEVRKALAAAAIVPSASDMEATTLNWRSIRSPDGSGKHWQNYELVKAAVDGPYVSPAAESLAVNGYASTDAAGTVHYYGPDAKALISDSFASTHCFSVEKAERMPGHIGVSFRPKGQRAGIVDLRGTFWVEIGSSRLRLLEFTYTNVPRHLERLDAGGLVEFFGLESGNWVVSRWAIRLGTQVGASPSREAILSPGTGLVVRPPQLATFAVNMAGGDLLSVTRDGTEVFNTDASRWSARLLRSNGSSAPNGTTVEFLRSGYFTVADSTGMVSLIRPVPGRHEVLVSTLASRRLGLEAVRRTVELRSGTAALDTLAVPSDEALLTRACGATAARRGQGAVFGVLLDAVGSPVRRDTLQVRLLDASTADAGQAARWRSDSTQLSNGKAPVSRGMSVVTDDQGQFFVCGIPRGARVRLSREPNSGEAQLVAERTIAPDGLLTELNASLTREP